MNEEEKPVVPDEGAAPAPEAAAPEAPAEAPKEEAAAPEAATPAVEDVAAVAQEEADKLGKSIMASVEASLKGIQANLTEQVKQSIAAVTKSKDTVETKKNLQKNNTAMNTAYSKSSNVKVFTKKNGKTLNVEKEDVEALGKWFQAVGHRDHALARKWFDKLEQKFEPLVEGTNADGGFTVPTVLTNILVDIRDDEVVIRPRATTIDLSMPGAHFDFTQIASRPSMSWGGENEDKGSTSMTFNNGSLTPYKMSGIIGISMELLQDSLFQQVPLIIAQLGRAIAREEEKVFAAGSGTGRPTGFSTYTYTTVDSGFSLDYRDFTNAWTRLNTTYRPNAVWAMNSRTLGAVLGMLDLNNRPIFQDGGIDPITGRPVRSILGNAIVEQNDLPSSGIWLIDLSQYYIGDKMKMTIDQSNEATVDGISAWQRNLTFLKGEERVDGEMLDSRAAVKISNTGIS